MEFLAQLLINGLTAGALYCSIAIGFSLIFGIMQLIYFAQCEMAMIGAFVAAGVYLALNATVGAPCAIVVAVLSGGLLAVLISCIGQRLLLYPLRKAAKVKGLIVSLGYSIILQNIVMLWISRTDMPFPLQSQRTWNLAGAVVSGAQLWVLLGTLVTWFAVWSILYWTRLGRAIRAVAQSRDGASLMGIPVERVITMTFAIAAITGAVAGILMGLYNNQIRYDMGFIPGIKGFTAAILGGVGNIRGALIAGLFMGLAESVLVGYFSSAYRDVFTFAILIIILLVRPQGLLGEGT